MGLEVGRARRRWCLKEVGLEVGLEGGGGGVRGEAGFGRRRSLKEVGLEGCRA